MKLSWCMTAAMAAVSIVAALAPAQGRERSKSPDQGMAGCWRAAGSSRGESFEVYFEISTGPNGGVSVLVTAPSLRLRRHAIGKATVTGRTLVVEADGVGGRYQGDLAADGRSITGSFTSRDSEPIRLVFSRAKGIPPPHRPQEPKRPYPYREERVQFVNDTAGITFSGTLTIPNTPGPHPAAVMITGAGCHDRDETLFEHRPFLVIADRLTLRGVAVLRHDDRGFGKTGGNVLAATSEDFATDTLAAIAYLQRRSDVDPRRIGVVGHSEGGMIAMIAASRSTDVRFAVSLAGVAVKCETLAYESLTAVARAHRVGKPLQIAGKLAMSAVIGVLKSPATDAEVAARLRFFLPDEVVPALASPWTRFIVAYDPATAIEKVRCPILGLFFEADVQVPAKSNAEALRAAAARGGNEDVTIEILPRLDHMFRIAAPTPADAARLDDTVAPEVLSRLGDWVVTRTRLARTR